MKWFIRLACLVLLVRQVDAAPASTQTPRPAPIAITITGVEGMVQVRENSDSPWRAAKPGMIVGEGAEFRTGPRSAVRCAIPPDQTITLDRLGTVKILQAMRDKGIVKTNVGMPYGRTRYDIEEAGIEHQSTLSTPGSTLAIRGTMVSVYDQPPFAPSAVSLTGRAEYRTAKRQIAFGGKGQGKTQVTDQSESAAGHSLLQTFVDPTSNFGRPEVEQKLINQLQAKGDLVLNNGRLALAFGGAVTDAQLAGLVSSQGRFNIALRWFGPLDFDLFVLTPDAKTGLPAYTLGNPSYKGSLFKDIGLFQSTTPIPPVTAAATPDGGRIKFDQIAFGGGGIELASWNDPVPRVPYTIAVALYDQRGKIKNYPDKGDFRIDAFLDGKRVPVLQNYIPVRDLGEPPVFGSSYQSGLHFDGNAGIILVTPPPNFKGAIDLTAVDLSPPAPAHRARRRR